MNRNFLTKYSVLAALSCVALIGIMFRFDNSDPDPRTEKLAAQIAEKNGIPFKPNAISEDAVKNAGEEAAQIRKAIIDAAEKLVDLKIDVVERGNFTQRTDESPVPVAFKQMWIHASSAQLRMVSLDEKNEEEWWTGFDSIKGPLTTGHLASVSGF